MHTQFLKKSKYLLLQFLKEPGGFSFFPSSFFWDKNIKNEDVWRSLEKYFNSEYSNISDKNNKLNLYIHIPFCTRICSYCNCFKKLLDQKGEIDTYIEYLRKEAKLVYAINGGMKIQINTIFIWWGTPNLLSSEQFKNMYSIIGDYFDISTLEQFLIDGHPNYYTTEKIDYLKSIWVNRITFAVQTFDEAVLEMNNRDKYNKDTMKKNLKYLKQKNITSNIDLLIWLKWQTFESVKNDIDTLKTLEVDNVSVHYFMNSNNIDYEMGENYLELIEQIKQYLQKIDLPHRASNVQEDYFASKRNSTLSLWATAVTNIFWNTIFQKPENKSYYEMLDAWKLPVGSGLQITKKDEMIKYIYLNILFWVNIAEFYNLYKTDIFESFSGEFKFLKENNIISIQNGNIVSKKSDFITLLYAGIFFIKNFAVFRLSDYNEDELKNFFSDTGELIDK